MDNPYRIEGPAQVNFSGGRSSAYMLHRILDAHGGTLPSDVVVLFCNTGKERPETLDFVQACTTHWGVPITWLEYRYRTDARGGRKEPKNWWAEVGHNTASRNGEPFSQLIESRKYVPNQAQRICTRELKVQTMRRYIQATRGWRKYSFALGLRYDERKRWGRILMEECDALMPMVEAGVTQPQVQRWWRGQPFDLAIPSWQGNCDLCFLKGSALLVDTMRQAGTELADWWIAEEDKARARAMAIGRPTERADTDSLFRREAPYRKLVELAKLPPDPTLFDGAEPGDWAACHCTD